MSTIQMAVHRGNLYECPHIVGLYIGLSMHVRALLDFIQISTEYACPYIVGLSMQDHTVKDFIYVSTI